jgi:hypothetical protein
MSDLFVSRLARCCLERDGWRVDRKCEPRQYAFIQRHLLAGGGVPPSVAVEKFSEVFGGLVLHRPTRWELALGRWMVPYYRPSGFVHWANFSVIIDRWYEPVESWMVEDVRRITGHTYWIGRLTPEGWPLFVDNAFHFFAVDVCTDRVFEVADCLSSFVEEVYRVSDPYDISGPIVGTVEWSRDE